MSATRDIVLNALVEERNRQDSKWGEQRQQPQTLWFTILGEEVGEVANAILEGKHRGLYEELVQVAAVAVAFAESLLPEDGVGVDVPEVCPTLDPATVDPPVVTDIQSKFQRKSLL